MISWGWRRTHSQRQECWASSTSAQASLCPCTWAHNCLESRAQVQSHVITCLLPLGGLRPLRHLHILRAGSSKPAHACSKPLGACGSQLLATALVPGLCPRSATVKNTASRGSLASGPGIPIPGLTNLAPHLTLCLLRFESPFWILTHLWVWLDFGVTCTSCSLRSCQGRGKVAGSKAPLRFP